MHYNAENKNKGNELSQSQNDKFDVLLVHDKNWHQRYQADYLELIYIGNDLRLYQRMYICLKRWYASLQKLLSVAENARSSRIDSAVNNLLHIIIALNDQVQSLRE